MTRRPLTAFGRPELRPAARVDMPECGPGSARSCACGSPRNYPRPILFLQCPLVESRAVKLADPGCLFLASEAPSPKIQLSSGPRYLAYHTVALNWPAALRMSALPGGFNWSAQHTNLLAKIRSTLRTCGLPFGIQIIARRGQDRLLLRAAKRIEYEIASMIA
jgi:hypothetical protein